MKYIAYAQWWPYYLEPINFVILPTLPSQATIDHLECPGLAESKHPEVTCTDCKLKYLYTQDYTLTLAGSPYYVVHNVYITPDVTFVIEDGVEIIFMENYDFQTRGELIVGCNHIETRRSYSNIGLASKTKYSWDSLEVSKVFTNKISFLLPSVLSSSILLSFNNSNHICYWGQRYL